jgi:hypothetical protein
LLHALADCSFGESADLHREVVVVKGRVLLENDRFLQVYLRSMSRRAITR